MSDSNHPQPDCPSCGQSLRGLSPLPPALLLRCPECGHVTTVHKIVERHVAQRRSVRHLLLWVTLLLLIAAAMLFRSAVQGIGG